MMLGLCSPIPADCSQLMNPQGPSLTNQLVSLGHPGPNQNQLPSSAQIQNLLEQSSSLNDTQNMVKIDDFLETLQEQEKNLSGDF